MRTDSLKGLTVVITGASSGIGKATALAFAAQGALIVVAARREEALDEVVDSIHKLGGQGFAVPTDVTDPTAMQELARRASEHFGGRIDVWFNNAGVGAIGSFREVPLEVHDEVIRVNLLGCMHGAHAVLPYFKKQESGILINMNSAGAWMPTPYSAAYSASKFGLRGFSEALRGELSSYPSIHICDVFAGFVNTTGFEHAANYVGKELKPMPPVYSPMQVAHAVVKLVREPKARRTIGWPVYLARFGYAVAPGLSVLLMKRGLDHYFQRVAEPAPVTEGHILTTSRRGQGIYGKHTPPRDNKKTWILAGAALLGLSLGMRLGRPQPALLRVG